MKKSANLIWFRQDLRVQDNPALNHAIEDGAPLIAIYLHNKDDSTQWALGEASKVFLNEALQSLENSLSNLGIKLQFIESQNYLKSIQSLTRELNITKVFWNRLYEPDFVERDKLIKSKLTEASVEVHTFKGALLWEPWEILQDSGKPYQVFTPFYKKCLKASYPILPLTSKKKVHGLKSASAQNLESFELLSKLSWVKTLKNHWNVSESDAFKMLHNFIEKNLYDYESQRNNPSIIGTSKMSPFLHFGVISPRQIWHELQKVKNSKGRETYEKEIVWREFAHHLIFHFPKTPDNPLRTEFENFPWEKNNKNFKLWTQGLTGFPIVDAGMRELWETGWMHNRVRMIVASFLIKDLRIHWLKGAKWFWDTLVDADLASNTLGWQWSAGCGADAAPFFRIFNPTTQSEKFDPEGLYIRKWVPELKNVPSKFIHAPHELSPIEQRTYNCILGKDYPFPIVDHKLAREEALKAFKILSRSKKLRKD
ncbi:MAG: deoxyribodipyrimidine photo-lyase [Proteobacteria bacterium]|nr:deoxyribodipyrimidine photo-lyase [Pseudomonadota bacterium]